MKMSDTSFLKTEPNQTDLKIQKPKTQFPQFGFQKNEFGGLGTVFTLSHSHSETAVNFVKLKPNRKLQFFAKPNWKPNRSHFMPTTHP